MLVALPFQEIVSVIGTALILGESVSIYLHH